MKNIKKAAFRNARTPTDEKFMSQQTVVESSPIKHEKKDIPVKRQRLDAITDALNQTGYFHKMSWPWLIVEFGGIKYPLYISRYYPDLKLALDQESDDNTELKKELCESNGIKFFVINGMAEIEDIKKQLGAVN